MEICAGNLDRISRICYAENKKGGIMMKRKISVPTPIKIPEIDTIIYTDIDSIETTAMIMKKPKSRR